ncbi:MAG: hypothetical protein IPM64_10390 [Phycisphaerales bacterium]|nr:hypothetical protein [Phycisphaerales bacterium]
MHFRAVATAWTLAFLAHAALAAEPAPAPDALIRTATAELVKMQEEDGAWPYEGVYRVGGKIPIGYRVAGTAIVCEALLFADPDGADSRAAIERGVAYILTGLEDKAMTPRTPIEYDVRIWGFTWALDLFCHLRAAKRMGAHEEQIREWIPKLVEAILVDEIPGGGWNYASRRRPAAFVTAPLVQTLLLAKSQGERVPRDALERAAKMLRASRFEDGAFTYSGLVPRRRPAGDAEGETTTRPASTQPASTRPASPQDSAGDDQPADRPPASPPATQPASAPARGSTSELPGSVARSAVCETSLLLLGDGSPARIAAALDAFHTHWDELEKRRKKTGTHAPPYGVAPYYFYFGHRYAAQAIQMLPPERREAERARLLEVYLRTRDEDGTWNDRVFPRSRNFGTAMIVMGLLGERMPLPPSLESIKGD